jgi:GLPGLI family protein
MNHKLLFFTAFGFCMQTRAQTSGTIHYKQTMRLDIHAGALPPGMDSLPKEHSRAMILYFNQDASLFAPEIDKKGNSNQEEGGGRLVIKIDEPDNRFFRDIKNRKLIQQREFMGRKFLIESETGKAEWKMSGKHKSILGYDCQEAMKTDKGREISVWFAPALSVSTGPGTAGDLPGLILEEDIGSGKMHILAEKIETQVPDASLFVKPKEGKKMSQKEFDDMMDQKNKEMEENGQGGDQIIIKTH